MPSPPMVRCPQCELLQVALCRRCQAKLRLPTIEHAAAQVSFVIAEKDLIERTLAHHPVQVAAGILGVSRRTLYRKIRNYELKIPSLVTA